MVASFLCLNQDLQDFGILRIFGRLSFLSMSKMICVRRKGQFICLPLKRSPYSVRVIYQKPSFAEKTRFRLQNSNLFIICSFLVKALNVYVFSKRARVTKSGVSLAFFQLRLSIRPSNGELHRTASAAAHESLQGSRCRGIR